MFRSLIEKDKKLRELTARDIMHNDYHSVTPDMHIEDAADILAKCKEIALPVLEGKIVVGILSEKDCINFMYNLEKYENPYSFVRSYMTEQVKVISANHTLYEIISFFVKTSIKVFPVVERGEIIGVIYRRDILLYTERIRADFLDN